MALDSTKYREYLHQVRSHPPVQSPLATVSAKVFVLSLVLFVVLEIGAELQWDDYPAGLLFPFGSLVFWALFYSLAHSGKSRSVNKSSRKLFEDMINEIVEVLSLLTPPSSAPIKSRPKFVPPSPAPKKQNSHSGLPKDIESALGLLGLPGCRDWNKIHKRYRELAKKFHPDLNPDETQTGNRFMIYDGAFRKLSAVKDKYFISSPKR